MKYLGLDVHGKATVFCLLNAEGEVVERGSLPTTAPDLTKLIQRLSSIDTLLCGQEVGTMTHFVHDVVTSAGAKILSFNAQHLRMIAASRKKTDRRDAYWIAKSLQTGLMPHAVHIPTTEVRRLRSLLAQRRALAAERKRWLLRARSHLREIGTPIAKGAGKITRKLEQLLACPDGLDADRADALELCARQEQQLRAELRKLEKTLYGEAGAVRPSEWRIDPFGTHYQRRLQRTSERAGPGGTRLAVPLRFRRRPPAPRAAKKGPDRPRASQDCSRGRGPVHRAHGLLHLTRRHDVRPAAAPYLCAGGESKSRIAYRTA